MSDPPGVLAIALCQRVAATDNLIKSRLLEFVRA